MKLRKDKWRKIILNNVCDVRDGTHDSPKYVSDKGVPLITQKNITENGLSFYDIKLIAIEDHKKISIRSNVEYGDIILSMIGENRGMSCIIDDKRVFSIKNVGLIKFSNQNEIINHYLINVLHSDTFRKKLESKATGTAQKFISLSAIRSLEIPLPPLEEQKQIAGLFMSIEKAMEEVEGEEKRIYQLKHKLLKDLFSDKKELGNLLNAKDFETIRFDKIAINISERVEPKKTELTTYVGLEHLDADNLSIERTGTPDDVIGTKLKIYKGDIIFGKRRAYLRKVAVSHFDGIASAHSMILRANEKNIEKDFLPYFMQSDTFMSRAVQISEGSLSPTIKNKTLAIQEFILPKKEKQKELIELFQQFDKTIGLLKGQRKVLKDLKGKLLNEILG